MELVDYVRIAEPAAVASEASQLLETLHPEAGKELFLRAFDDTVDLFAGRMPGFRACNTPYHDLNHTLQTVQATARLLHGMQQVHCTPLDPRDNELLLAAALLHDSGYIQADADPEGTGAKYTVDHVDRSVAFLEAYFRRRGLEPAAAESAGRSIRCTDLGQEIDELPFQDEPERLMGCILGSADLLGQLADVEYVEKLGDLYLEFVEGGITEFSSQLDLLRKTNQFIRFVQFRLEKHLGDVRRFMRPHFLARHGLDQDVYGELVQKNMDAVSRLLEEQTELQRWLRRTGGLQPEDV
jgi:hypothetical protein